MTFAHSMIERIAIVLPTRGRPWSCLEAVASILKNAAQPNAVSIIICMDDDDPQPYGLAIDNVDTLIEPRKRFVGWINFAMTGDVLDCEWLAWGGDDVRYLTPGWDDIVREHKEICVYGEDGIHNEKMATHPFFRSDLVQALGYAVPKELTHLCADSFIEALCRELHSIAYDPRIKMEHLHFTAGKSVEDQTYRDAKAHWNTDQVTFDTIIKPTIPDLARKVRQAMGLP